MRFGGGLSEEDGMWSENKERYSLSEGSAKKRSLSYSWWKKYGTEGQEAQKPPNERK